MSPRRVDRRPGIAAPDRVRFLVRVMAVACAMLFLADALYQKHGHFPAEYLFGFYGLVGFTVCVALVLAAKWMRTVVMRKEDYYDDN